MSEPLKPCPFCGHKAELYDATPHLNWAHCLGCGAETDEYDTMAEAVAAWNRRAGDPTP
jgi:Lar family restriction alleviation protein